MTTTTETVRPHRCRDCPRCPSRALTDPRDNVTCDWDCGCPDYPPPEVQVLQERS